MPVEGTEWRIVNGQLKAFIKGTPVAWFPQPGSQEAFLQCPIFECCLSGNRGGGKGLPLDEPVITNKGEKRIGDCVVGDTILAGDGAPTNIVGVFPQGLRKCYEVVFEDGSKVTCDDQHKWTIRGGETVSMVKLISAVARQSTYIPVMTNPVEFCRYETKPEIPFKIIANMLVRLQDMPQDHADQFIPDRYLYQEAEARLKVLEELNDLQINGEFIVRSLRLAKNIRWLIKSLGGVAWISIRDGFYAVAYNYDKQWLKITSIKETTPQETVCIKVDHPDGLFLTRDFVVTHNTDVLLMDYAQDVGKGYGAEWKGILFRKTYPELEDVISKSRKWFSEIWPEGGPNPAHYNVQKSMWTWKTGESLKFRHMAKPNDYWSYHGHNYPWIGWEEITTWPNLDCYTRMFSCCRSSHPEVAKRARIRSTTNPYGAGHTAVKKRFRLPIEGNKIVGPVIRDSKDKSGNIERPRVAIRSSLAENKILLLADPSYLANLRSSARNAAELAAWIDGSWDITCGGMFDDIWEPKTHIIQDIPFEVIRNSGWFLNRAYDHGQSKPFSVGWWAASNGNPIQYNGNVYGEIEGDLFLFNQWYGYTGEDNEGLNMPASMIAAGIKAKEQEMGLWRKIKRGPADSQIFANHDGKVSPASEMRKVGIFWDAVDKSKGSRKQGWEAIREYLNGAKPSEADGKRHVPGIFVCSRCKEWLRTVPCLPRSDKDLDDVNTEVEDHDGDMTRYRLRWKRKTIGRIGW